MRLGTSDADRPGSGLMSATGALEDLLQRIARLAGHLPDLAELEINPLIVSPGGAVVVDAREGNGCAIEIRRVISGG
jgi:hypothetical protein